MKSRTGRSRAGDVNVEVERMVLGLRNLLPYLKDWDAWQRELRRLENNIAKLRKHRYGKLARTLQESLLILRIVLAEERKVHAFTVNRLIIRLDGDDKTSRKRNP